MEKNQESSGDLHTVVNLSLLQIQDPALKFLEIKKIHEACKNHGFFHVINHGVPDSVIEEALNVNAKFFEMAIEEKEDLISDDIYKEVRFGRVKAGEFSRDFLKLYAYPFDRFITSWPKSPPDYREKMGMYSKEVRKLSIKLFGAIMESLNIGEKTHLYEKFKQGFQILGINCYPPISGQDIKTGLPPHTDHSIITVLLQSSPGLQVVDRANGGSWKNVPGLKGSLQVLVGDHLEVLSNGLYKSVLHRAIPSCCNTTRFSIASLHSLEMDEIVEPIVNEQNVRRYRGSSLRDFLKHLASRNKRAFIETIRNV